MGKKAARNVEEELHVDDGSSAGKEKNDYDIVELCKSNLPKGGAASHFRIQARLPTGEGESIAMKKALLITVSSDEIKKIRRARYIKFQQCTMPYLAAFFPPDWEVVHIDEEQQQIDYSGKYDLVGLTFHTPCCYHAYDI